MTGAAQSHPRSTAAMAAVAGAAVTSIAWYLHQRAASDANKRSETIPAELQKCKYAAELTLAVAMAIRTGNNMVGFANAKGTLTEDTFNLGIETKSGDADFCTKVDIENEEYIMAQIQKAFPSHKIIGEETTGTGEIDALTHTATWIIDPIDGTTNFASGIPLTCVSIGLCVNKVPVMGVIYAPLTKELYMAVTGCGAYRNGDHIAQRFTSKPLNQAVICCEFGYPRDKPSIQKMVGAVERIMENGCRAIRQLGSGCLDLAYVATGRLDVVYAGVAGEGWKPWDYAAGVVLLQESGCLIEGIPEETRGAPFDLYSTSLIAAGSRELLDECRKIVTNK